MTLPEGLSVGKWGSGSESSSITVLDFDSEGVVDGEGGVGGVGACFRRKPLRSGSSRLPLNVSTMAPELNNFKSGYPVTPFSSHKSPKQL